jgi:hypothetical protein
VFNGAAAAEEDSMMRNVDGLGLSLAYCQYRNAVPDRLGVSLEMMSKADFCLGKPTAERLRGDSKNRVDNFALANVDWLLLKEVDRLVVELDIVAQVRDPQLGRRVLMRVLKKVQGESTKFTMEDALSKDAAADSPTNKSKNQK